MRANRGAADWQRQRHQLGAEHAPGADFSPDNGRGQFLGIWRFLAGAGATGGAGAAFRGDCRVAATGVHGFTAAAVFAVTIPRLKHRLTVPALRY